MAREKTGRRPTRTADAADGPPPRASVTRASRAAIGRFSLYLRHLAQFARDGMQTVASGRLAKALGLTAAQVRKDLAFLGSLGHRGVGYPIDELNAALRKRLGIDRTWKVAVVGVGNLARALLRYRGFAQQGFRIVALFDADPAQIGRKLEGLEVHAAQTMSRVIAQTGAELALLTVPAEAAQAVADDLVAAGIRGILNFAPVVLRLPAQVSLVAVDLAIQLEQLTFLVHLRT
jgi:redox-sensing transcriptional repressor